MPNGNVAETPQPHVVVWRHAVRRRGSTNNNSANHRGALGSSDMRKVRKPHGVCLNGFGLLRDTERCFKLIRCVVQWPSSTKTSSVGFVSFSEFVKD